MKKELVEKQGLLNQAARALELYEEQKAATARAQEQCQQSLEEEREKVTKLEKGTELLCKVNDGTQYVTILSYKYVQDSKIEKNKYIRRSRKYTL